jgi:mannose-P-dolichol utilization defect protein 1
MYTDVACIKALVAKGLGYLILLGALAVKVPQILKIVNAKSVKGLALSMFLLELVGYGE